MKSSKKKRNKMHMDMVNVAIKSAEFHGINLHAGVPNNANGDCAIEAIADNISTRSCFKEVFEETPEFYRMKWMSETEDLVFKISGWEERKFRSEWNILKQPQCYEYELGDYMLIAIAHCVQKDILVFNTKAEGHFDPIFVVQASSLANRPANTRVPILLAYNEEHFEGLLPNSEEDQLKTVELKELYLSNNYNLKKKDMPVFSNQSQTTDELNPSKTKIVLSAREDKDPPRKKIKDMTAEEKKDYNRMRQKVRRESLSGEKTNSFSSKKIKDMTVEERREYNRLKQKETREQLSDEKREVIKETEKIRQKRRRNFEQNDYNGSFKRSWILG